MGYFSKVDDGYEFRHGAVQYRTREVAFLLDTATGLLMFHGDANAVEAIHERKLAELTLLQRTDDAASLAIVRGVRSLEELDGAVSQVGYLLKLYARQEASAAEATHSLLRGIRLRMPHAPRTAH